MSTFGMPVSNQIIIDFPANLDGSLTHQIRNLGEDLWRLKEQEKLGDMGGIQEIDRATDRLIVTVLHLRMVASVRKIVEISLTRHFLADRSVVTFYQNDAKSC